MPADLSGQSVFAGARRHVGICLSRRRIAAPRFFDTDVVGEAERLEQLCALESGLVIRMPDAAELSGPDVNTAEDLERVAALMARQQPT